MPTGPARIYCPLASGGCGQNDLSPRGLAARLEITPCRWRANPPGAVPGPLRLQTLSRMSRGAGQRESHWTQVVPLPKPGPWGGSPSCCRTAEQGREGVNKEGKSNYNWFLPSHLLETKTWMEGSRTTTRPKSLSTASGGREGPS